MICRICGNAAGNTAYEVKELYFDTRDPFGYFQCATCGCLQIASVPADMSKYYPSNYYSFFVANETRYTNPVKSMLLKMRSQAAIWNRSLLGNVVGTLSERLDLKSLRYVPLTHDSRILDVGCGNGFLLYDLMQAGFTALKGVDPYIEKSIEYENNLAVRKETIHEQRGEWDLVMMHHSFEHLADPRETLQSVARILAPAGACMIRIPTVSSYAWQKYGVNWVQLDAPRHFFLHSVESIRYLAGQTGLQLDQVIYDSSAFQLWGSEQYEQNISLLSERSYAVNPGKSIFTRQQIRDFKREAKKLNAAGQGDQAIFILSRKRVS